MNTVGEHPRGSSKMSKSQPHQPFHLMLSQHSATLSLRHTSVDRAGLYECRVDFFRSPSHTNFVNFTVIGKLLHVLYCDLWDITHDLLWLLRYYKCFTVMGEVLHLYCDLWGITNSLLWLVRYFTCFSVIGELLQMLYCDWWGITHALLWLVRYYTFFTVIDELLHQLHLTNLIIVIHRLIL